MSRLWNILLDGLEQEIDDKGCLFLFIAMGAVAILILLMAGLFWSSIV